MEISKSEVLQEKPLLSGLDIEFRAETIYFVVLDRFASGSPGKKREDDHLYDPAHADWKKYWGGDLQGLTDKLDYLQSFGISAVWTTPLFEQIHATSLEENEAPIHGYWTRDFKRINPRWLNDPSEKRLFTRDDTCFDFLLKEMHDKEMKFILDIVCNHSSPNTNAGKGKLYDDGRLVADFDNDVDHWYHHYGPTLDWEDEWQVQKGELGGLATFNENNILFRNYIKDAIKLWISKGVDALRIDTVKHMPAWFWQEFTADMTSVKPDLFRFGEWIDSHPGNDAFIRFANQSGMSMLDFGFCHAVRDALGFCKPEGFLKVKELLDMDGRYSGATELVTFFENHDMSRFQSLNPSNEVLHQALALLLTSRGTPCIYYGCEQYLHNDTDGGGEPYNRPLMEHWEETEARRIIKLLAEERRANPAIQWGCQWPKWVEADTYCYLRKYRNARCLVILHKGEPKKERFKDLEFPDGDYACILSGQKIHIENGEAEVELIPHQATVLSIRAPHLEGKLVVRIQVNGAPTKPGDRLGIIGDCEELGFWDLNRCVELECINDNTWFNEVAFEVTAGKPVGYKYVILPAGDMDNAHREVRLVRRRILLDEGTAKWRDRWEQ